MACKSCQCIIHHRHTVVMTTFMVCFLTAGTAYGNASIYYNYWKEYFRENSSLTSLVGSCNIGLILILGPLASFLANRFGHRIIVCIGGLLSSAAMVGGSFAPSVPVLLATHIVAGIGWCLCFVPGSMAVSFYWKPKYLGTIFGITICGIGVGQFVAPIIVEYMAEAYSWRGSLLIQAGLNFNLVVCGAILYPTEGMKKASNFLELSLLKRWKFTNFLVYSVLVHMGVSVATVHLAFVVKMAVNANSEQVAWVIATFGIFGACARLFHGFLSKYDCTNVLLQQMICIGSMGVFLIFYRFVPNYGLMVAVTALMGFCMGSLSLNSLLTILFVGLDSRTAGYGFFAMAAGIGIASGAPIAGFLSDITNGNYTVSMYFGGGVQILAVLVMIGPLVRWGHVMKRFRAEEAAKLEIGPVRAEDIEEAGDNDTDRL